MGLGVFGAVEKSLGLFFKTVNLVLKHPYLIFEIALLQLVNVDNVVISMLADGASEANAAAAVLAEAFHVLAAVV